MRLFIVFFLLLAACGANGSHSGYAIPTTAKLPVSVKENDWPQAVRIVDWSFRQNDDNRYTTFTVANDHPRTIDHVMIGCRLYYSSPTIIAGHLAGSGFVKLDGQIPPGSTRTFKDKLFLGHSADAETPMTCDRVISATEAVR